MGISCTNSGAMAWGNNCRRTDARDFGGVMGRPQLEFEARILQQHFATRLADWESHPRYHAYHIVNVLHGRTTLSLGAVWHEYARRPAPTLTTRARPIVGGERSTAAGGVTIGRHGPWLPLYGGPVRHYVDRRNFALINVTERGHVLHPGYIMRWIERAGASVLSHTVGRGVGPMARTNERMGTEIFDDLDEDVASALPRR
ncbi:MAG: hypothetical protein ACE37F_10010 [Nannocystaceae bacterium]|nr:hypothetical protein [bacterium]